MKQNKDCKLADLNLIKNLNTYYYNLIDTGSTSNVYELLDKTIVITSTSDDKYKAYRMALKENYNTVNKILNSNKFKHIPKIFGMIECVKKQGKTIYIIHREQLFPVTSTKKLARIQKIQELVKNNIVKQDPIADEILDIEFMLNYEYGFDFGPHWIMQNSRGKLVICDVFCKK